MNRHHYAVTAVATLLVDQDLIPALSPTDAEIKRAFGPAFGAAPVGELRAAVETAIVNARQHRIAVAAQNFRDQHGRV